MTTEYWVASTKTSFSRNLQLLRGAKMLFLLTFLMLFENHQVCPRVVLDKKAVPSPHFSHSIELGTVSSSRVDEASGLAASRKHIGILYTLNDHKGPNQVFALDAQTGSLRAVLTITGAENVDWEDIAVGKCHGGNYCIYIGDTGDSGSANKIYRVIEPDNLSDQHIHYDSVVHFSWSEPDCESVMVDPSENVYIISKVSKHHHAKISKIPHSAWGSGSTVHLTEMGTLPIRSSHHDPVGADISPDGTEVLVKTHEEIYYWYVPSQDYLVGLEQTPVQVPYTQEHQGESVCWDPKGSGYYTTSEGEHQPIYYYSRA